MSSTPNSASRRKLVQTRLSFFKAPDKYTNEPPKKKLAFAESSEDQENKKDNVIESVTLTSPTNKELDKETCDIGSELLNGDINNTLVIDITSPIKKDCQTTIDGTISSIKKKKRNNSEEDIKKRKKLKLDESKNEKSEINSKTTLEQSKQLAVSDISLNDRKDEIEDADKDDCSMIVDQTLECSLKEDLNSTLDTSCEAVVNSPSISDSAKKVTPNQLPRKKAAKQSEKGQDAVKKREEKEKLKQEKDLKRNKEKEERQKLKEEKELIKKKELEEKEESRRKAKEEKEKKKQQEIELKNEEKRRKEEDKKRKEDEIQKKKDDEKKRKEEEIQKKKEEDALHKLKFAKEAAVFSTFFKKIQKPEEAATDNITETIIFKPFAVKNRMRLAPINRNPMDDDRKKRFDDDTSNQDVQETYLTQLRCGEIKPGHSIKTWPLEEIYQDDDTEVEEIPLEPSSTTAEISGRPSQKVPRAKLLLFNENRRPPYWGTWRKKCISITPRRPFGIYKDFDYEVDSDEEWEEEEPGESLHGSDDEKEKDEQDGEDDYDIDNDIFVPHGYLSEDEAPADETWSVEQQKEKLKLLGEQFDQERSEKTKQLRPIVLGCIWDGPESCSALIGNTKISALLLRCKPWILNSDLPIQLNNPEEPYSPDDRDLELTSPATTKRGAFPDDAIPTLITRVHGARKRHRMIAKEFVHTWAQENPNSPMLSMAAVSRKIKEIAQWQECPEPPLLGRQCWFVSKEVRELNGLADLALRAPDTSKTSANGSLLDDSSVSVLSPSTPKITKFTRVLTEEERRQSLTKPKQLICGEKDDSAISKPAEMTSPAVPSPTVEKAILKLGQFRAPNAAAPAKKKVAILFSVPRGEPMVKSSEIIAQTDNSSNKIEAKSPENKTISPNPPKHDIPVIDLDDSNTCTEKTLKVEAMEITIVS